MSLARILGTVAGNIAEVVADVIGADEETQQIVHGVTKFVVRTAVDVFTDDDDNQD